MEYISPEKIKYFNESSQIVEKENFSLVELQIVPQHGNIHVTAVIASKNPEKDIGVADCSKVHRSLQAELISLLEYPEDKVFMEVCSPGLERNIKNAWEFTVFTGRKVRVWDKTVSDWVGGTLLNSDTSQVTLGLQDGTEKSVLFENIAKAKFIHL